MTLPVLVEGTKTSVHDDVAGERANFFVEYLRVVRRRPHVYIYDVKDGLKFRQPK